MPCPSQLESRVQANFDKALAHVLKYEGGYSDHPEDPGGATNFGITIGVLSEYRGTPVTKQDVRSLTLAEAARIYRARYWNAASCDQLPAGIDVAVFDCAVNQGVGRAARFLQTAVRVGTDGVIGPLTLKAVNNARPDSLLCEFMALRMRSYGMLRSLFRTFGLGWSRRLMATYAEAITLMNPSQLPQLPQLQTPPRFSMDYIIQRLKEPSTYAGIAAFLASVGVLGFSEHEWNQIFAALAAVAAALAVVIKERPTEISPPKSPVVPSNWPGQQ
jgi:lysozyme family protein